MLMRITSRTLTMIGIKDFNIFFPANGLTGLAQRGIVAIVPSDLSSVSWELRNEFAHSGYPH